MKEIQPEDIWNDYKIEKIGNHIIINKIKDIVKNTPNDQELGAEIRRLFFVK